MSEEQLKAFLEKVKGDISLQEKLKMAGDADAVHVHVDFVPLVGALLRVAHVPPEV